MDRTLLLSGFVFLGAAIAPAFAMPAGHKMDHPTDDPKAAAMDHGDHCGMPMGEGAITALDVAKSKVKIDHKPIASLEWPAMVMEFAVAKPVDLAAFAAGDEVHFLLVEEKASKSAKAKTYRVAAMCDLGAEQGAHDACMKSMHEAAMKAAAESGMPCDMEMDGEQMPGMDHKDHSSLRATPILLAHSGESDDDHCKKDDYDGDGKAGDGHDHAGDADADDHPDKGDGHHDVHECGGDGKSA